MAQYKYFTQDGNPVLVDGAKVAKKDVSGNDIVSTYSTKAELNTTKDELQENIDNLALVLGNDYYTKSETYTRTEIDAKDTAINNTLTTHTADTVVHTNATERANLNTAYDHSLIAPALTTVHHDVRSTKMKDDVVAVNGVDSTDISAKYDFAGNSITATYATKDECNAKYTKPASGILKTDLEANVQASLEKADASATNVDLQAEITRAKGVEDTKVDKVSGKGLSENDYTTAEKTNALTAYNHSQSAHAPSDAEKNIIIGIQKNGADLTPDANRKVNITVPDVTSFITKDVDNLTNYSTTIAMNSAIATATADMATLTWVNNQGFITDISGKQDKLVAGTNINIAADGKTISATDTTYTAGTNIQINDGQISATDTTYLAATTTTDGLMSAADKIKLDDLSVVTLKTLKTSEALTAGAAIGKIESGTTIPANTSLWDILNLMFKGSTTLRYLYYGVLDNEPTGDTSITAGVTAGTITKMDVNTATTLTTTGLTQNLAPNTLYLVFAIEKDANLLLVKDGGTPVIYTGSGSIANPATEVSGTSMYIYYLNGPSDPVGDGTSTIYTFKCE